MQRILASIATIVVALVFFVYNYYYGVNFPYQDDFLLIQFIASIVSEDAGISGVVTELFRTFNDHKAAVPRFVALVDYQLNGFLNFRTYIAIVSVNLIYIFYFLYLQFRKTKLPLVYLLPVPFLYFQPLYHEVSNWALTGLQHSFLTAFTVTALLLVSRKSKIAFAGAMLCCFLATFTHGNGILSFPAVIFYFLCLKDFRGAIATVVSMLVCFAIYFMGYESGQAGNLPNSAIIFLTSLFGFIGASMSLWGAPEAFSSLWGLVIVVFCAVLVFRIGQTYIGKSVEVRPGTAELLSLFAFIFVTSFVVALFRSWAGSMIASRFELYAALSTSIFYILLLNYSGFFRKRNVLWIVTGMSIFYWCYSYYKFTGMIAAQKATYLADIYNWETNRDMFSVEKSIIRNADFYLTPAREQGFFKSPLPVVSKTQLDSMFSVTKAIEVDEQMYVEEWETKRIMPDTIEILTHQFVSSNTYPERKGLGGSRLMVLKEQRNGKLHLMNATPKVEARQEIIVHGNYYKPGFNTLFRVDDLAPGRYLLGILDVADDGRKSFYRLGKSLEVTGAQLRLLE